MLLTRWTTRALSRGPLGPPATLQGYIHPPVIDHDGANIQLQRLVSERRFAAAERLRHDLLDKDVNIRPHICYESVAYDVLRRDNSNLTGFTHWLNLTPDRPSRSVRDHRRPYSQIIRALLESGSPAEKLPMIYHFGIFLAGKGYLDLLFLHIIPVLVRFSPQGHAGLFLREVDATSYHFHLTVKVSGIALVKKTARRRQRIIHICCHAGWIEEAMYFLRMGHEQSLPISVNTLNGVLKVLKPGIHDSYIQEVNMIRAWSV